MKLRLVIAIAAALVITGWLLTKQPESPVSDTEPTRLLATGRATTPRLPAPRSSSGAASAEVAAEEAQSTNLLTRILKNGESLQLTSEQAEAYVAENRRSVESLLAAFRVSSDKAFLKEAQEKFPNDPRVAFASVFKSDSPEERRQWLENFKKSAPDNSMPNYLSARDFFKAGQPDQAIQELLAASGKSAFQDYSMDFLQSAEEAYRFTGYSEAESKATAGTQLLLPHLTEMKQVGVSLGELAKTYRQAGDEASAQAALQLGANFGQQLQHPGRWTTVIEDLVGKAVERIALTSMDPASAYGGTGQTVQNRLDEIAQQKATTKAFFQQTDGLLARMSEQDVVTFYDRQKVSGEVAAMQWALNKYGQK